MDDAKRRAMIKSQAAKKKRTGDMDPKGDRLQQPVHKKETAIQRGPSSQEAQDPFGFRCRANG